MVAYSYYESDPRVIREAEAAVDAGFETDVLALKREGTADVEVMRGVRVIRLNQQKYRGGGHLRYLIEYVKFFFRCFVKTTSLHIKNRYAVIHVNNMPDFMVFSSLIPRLTGTKVVLDIHDPMPNTFVSKFRGNERSGYFRLLLWQERLSSAFSNRVLTVSHPVKDCILMKHGLRPELVEVIANFADGELFPVSESFTLSEKVKFVFHGTILERSGLRLLMDALAKCRNPHRMIVKIIGEGDFSEPLKQLVKQYGLEQTVDFDNHCYPAHAISELIKDCTVGLVPLEISSITNYALPLKLLEYISMGLPVVSVRNKAISYYFSEQDCIFFDWNDPTSLSKVMDYIAEDPTMLLPYRKRSLELRDKFSWTGEKLKYIALLRELSGLPEQVSAKCTI